MACLNQVMIFCMPSLVGPILQVLQAMGDLAVCHPLPVQHSLHGKRRRIILMRFGGWTIVNSLCGKPQAPGDEARIAGIEMDQIGRCQGFDTAVDTGVLLQVARATNGENLLAEQWESGAFRCQRGIPDDCNIDTRHLLRD